MIDKSYINKLLEGVEVEYKTLGEVSKLRRGRVMSKIYLSENIGSYPVFSSQTSNNGIIGSINEYDFDGEYLSWTTDGAHAGTIFHRKGKFSITNVCGLILINNPEFLSYKYLYYWLSIVSKKYVYSGMGNPKLMSNQVEKIKIAIPPIHIQEKIVNTLDVFTKCNSELKAELKARKNQYEYYRDKLLTFDDNEVEYKTLGEVVKVQRGASPRPISKYLTENDGVHWIKIGDTKPNSKFVSKTKEMITIEGSLKSRVLKKGDLILSNSMSFGRPYILDINGAIHDGWASLSDYSKDFNTDFLFHYLSSSIVQYFWKSKINSSSVSNLNSKIIQSLPIPIPPIHIQNEIVEKLDNFDKLTSSIVEGLPREIELRDKQYEYYRDLLLDFSGELND